MNKQDFFYDLPDELIAQSPIRDRSSSRLLCLPRDADSSGSLTHMHFYDLPKLLRPDDCLVLNDSRVLPARLIGKRSTGAAVEVLLLRPCNSQSVIPNSQFSILNSQLLVWECLVRPGKKMRTGTDLHFGDGELTATVKGVLDNGNRIVEFSCDSNFYEIIEKIGKMPIPPYIKKELEDSERYQTVYSHIPGSAAAPTAGLHFTHELLEKLESLGIKICYVTLHVGLGTFRPVKTDNIEEHVMHSEFFTIPEQTAQTINQTKESGGRIIAVGTTSCRTLESACDDNGLISARSGDTDIFIYPGYEFKCIDGLITNFHLPESTLIMLVSAFAGRERVLDAYKTAVAEGYRFFSFGDAMLII